MYFLTITNEFYIDDIRFFTSYMFTWMFTWMRPDHNGFYPTSPNPTSPNPILPNPTSPIHISPNPTLPIPTLPNPTSPNPTLPIPTLPNPISPIPISPNPTLQIPTLPNPISPNPTSPIHSHISRWISLGVKMVTDDASLRHEFRVSTGRRSIRNPPKRHFACILRHNITSPLKLGARRASVRHCLSSASSERMVHQNVWFHVSLLLG